MNADEFVAAYVRRVCRSAIKNMIDGLEEPPGRRPNIDLQRASDWFLRLPPDDRAIVEWIIADTAHAAAFGALAVVDGARHTGPDRYELMAVDADGTRSVVNPEDSEDLHDTFQGLVMLPNGRLRTDDIRAL